MSSSDRRLPEAEADALALSPSRRALLTSAAAALSLGAAAGLATPAAALEPAAARAFVETVSDEILTLIKSRISISEKRRRFRALLERKGAVEDVARVASGRAWAAMSGGQRRRYVSALTDIVTNLSVSGFDEYRGERLRIVDATTQGSSVFVRTVLDRAAGRPAINVVWRIIDRNGPAQLFDLIVDGVSLLKTQRDTLAARLNQSGGDIEKFVAGLEAEARGG